LTTLTEKLHPRRFPGMSGKMAAIVGCILRQEWTRPTIAELIITSDGFLLARNRGQVHCGFIGAAADLERNWDNLLEVAGLTGEERQEAHHRYRRTVRDYRLQRQRQP